MQDLATTVSVNMKKLREEKKLSLDHVAKITGVSKSMLGQIERGEVNPTITTIWKIANGLKISFTALLYRPQTEIEIIKKEDVQPLIEDNGKLRNYPLYPFDETRRFETYFIELDPGCYLSSDAHLQGSQEFITVFSGELNIRVRDEEYTLCNGDSIRFKADAPHTYHNASKELTKLSMIIYYPE